MDFCANLKNFDDYFSLSNGEYDKIRENNGVNFKRCVNSEDFFGDFRAEK